MVGARCEQKSLQIPYKPLSQRMLEEPFWLGLMTIAAVLVIIGLVWCVKRHFAEKLERFMVEELERGKLPADMVFLKSLIILKQVFKGQSPFVVND